MDKNGVIVDVICRESLTKFQSNNLGMTIQLTPDFGTLDG
jgi:hypothetical protein